MHRTKSKSHARALVNSSSCKIRLASQPPVIDELAREARTATQRMIDQTVAYTHDHPDKALVYALATGYVLRTLPVTRVLGGVCRIALSLIKPAAMFYGISKVVAARH